MRITTFLKQNRSRIGWSVLIISSAFALYWLCSGVFNSDAEGRLFETGFGSIAVCLVLPFWVAYRGKLPFMLLFILTCIAITGVFYLNSWAERKSGGAHFTPFEHVGYLLFCIPGVVAMWCKKIDSRE